MQKLVDQINEQIALFTERTRRHPCRRFCFFPFRAPLVWNLLIVSHKSILYENETGCFCMYYLFVLRRLRYPG